jgi:hypothetical protein
MPYIIKINKPFGKQIVKPSLPPIDFGLKGENAVWVTDEAVVGINYNIYPTYKVINLVGTPPVAVESEPVIEVAPIVESVIVPVAVEPEVRRTRSPNGTRKQRGKGK